MCLFHFMKIQKCKQFNKDETNTCRINHHSFLSHFYYLIKVEHKQLDVNLIANQLNLRSHPRFPLACQSILLPYVYPNQAKDHDQKFQHVILTRR